MVFDGYYIDKAKAAEWASRFSTANMAESEFEEVELGWRRFDPSVGPDAISGTDLPAEYRELRNVILEAWKGTKIDVRSKNNVYKIDLAVGLALYDFLHKQGFNEIYAETDDWWRYISIKLCPDLTYLRYPKEGETRINRKRFFDHPRRIWLKTLWWYVHLCWQGSLNATEAVLVKMGTDAISQIIERPGRGYRPDVSRVIAAKYAAESDWCEAKPFQKTMARNSVYSASFEPTLFAGGVEGYVDRIFLETKEWMER